MPKEALKAYGKTLSYSKKKAILTGNCGRRLNNSGETNTRTNNNLTDKIANLQTLLVKIIPIESP